MANFKFTKQLIWLWPLISRSRLVMAIFPTKLDDGASRGCGVVVFMAMAITMLVTLRRVLEEY